MTSPAARPPALGGTRAYVVWIAAVTAYAIAVLQRTTMGVAGLEATERFGASATIVSSFVVLQLAVYAICQIPAGLLLDRYGSRVTLVAGALLMGAGQLLMAQTETVGVAMVARIVLGAGDALTFSSAVRLVPAWFPASRVPILTQLTGILGQVGQIASAVPFVAVLTVAGWGAAFSSAASVSAVAALLALLVVRASPPGTPRPRVKQDLTRIPLVLARILRHPSTQLGFFTHFTAGFTGIAFSMMWGYPYLTAGEGLSRPAASAIMTVLVVVAVVAGPLIGALTQRHPLRRSTLVLLIVATIVVPLLALVLWPGPAPIWLLVVLVSGFSIGGPASSIGFDFPRTDLARHRLGTATGVVIMGGFVGGLTAILLIGVVLDLLRPEGNYDLEAFRLAFAVQLPLLAIGVAGMLITRRNLRRRMAAQGSEVPPWRDVWRSGRWRRL
ncbi:MFS transporter [Brachybacterium vulturis]|uniref:MFS transporter n=1 Tax=Brachybacterium vulturis TaxID=2017484 RepID=A0A291GM16_9MICO|nr:MFS transporter [Brachybacterium vulturis]ATG51100.1 MFS transporter [Brachybacterium vulturis]